MNEPVNEEPVIPAAIKSFCKNNEPLTSTLSDTTEPTTDEPLI